ncbi:hypothetical protein ABZ570_03410 [Micromonospora sp. NPDC007271]|uniref:hypothetical protein n=1 Tax=Micromonospora sp. NPDC007271 TaxID=3154587 RepID=UPI00340BC845
MARSKLEDKAHEFAVKLQELLAQTVVDDHVRVLARINPAKRVVAVGTNLTKDFATSPVALRTIDRRHQLYLDLQCQVYLEEGTGHLTMHHSYFAVSASPDAPDPLFHYDYERGKRDAEGGYTEAHLQVFGVNTELDPIIQALSTKRKKKQIGELHFPVGGRRFRPALEDVLEFLIDEQLVNPKAGWQQVLDKSRDEFRMIQLKAMVRRYPEVAREALADNDQR